jgi:hypothetical protein
MKHSLRVLVRELRRTFQAHLTERREAVTRLYLCGGTSRLRKLVPFLADELGVPVEMLPVSGEELVALEVGGDKGAAMAQALALGLCEVVPDTDSVNINFRRGAYEHSASQSWFREKIIGLVLIAACFFCALGSLFASKYYAIGLEEEALMAALEKSSIQVFDENLSPEKVSKKLKGDGEEQNIIPNRSARDFFIEISTRTPKGMDIEFTDVEVDLYRRLIKVKATTTAASVVDSYVEALEGYDCFKGNVTKGGTESVGDRVRFDMTIAPECPGAKKDDKKKG